MYGNGYDIESIASKIGLSNSGTTGIDQKRIENYQFIRMNVTRGGYEPNKFMLKKGMPVKWIINGRELNGCNNEIIVPNYKLDFRVIQGEQTITNNTGTVLWSCWMGMIRGSFNVYEK